MDKIRITEREKKREPEARKRLVSAALELFTRKGYAATSVREIVEVAGVTKPVLYYYFGSKEGIYLDMFREPFKLFEELLDSYPGGAGICVTKALTELCDRVLGLFVEHLDTARLMYSIYYGPPQGAPYFDFDGYHQKLYEKVKTLIHEGIKSGDLYAVDAEDLEDLTWVVIGALNVAMEEQLCHKEPRIGGQALARILSLILRRIACRFPPQTGRPGDMEFQRD